MSVFLAILGRLVLIAIGFCVASIVSSIALNLLALVWFGWSGENLPLVMAGSILFTIPFVALFVAYLSLIPAAVAVAIGEAMALRDWLYWSLAGGGVAAVVKTLLSVDLQPSDGTDSSNVLIGDAGIFTAYVAAGLVGGIAYWAIAGRSAGLPRRPTSSAPSGS